MSDEKRKPKDGYEVGYAKPPEATQFKKGHVPHPAKKKRQKKKTKKPNGRDMLAAVTSEKIVVKIKNRQRLVSRDEAALRAEIKSIFEKRSWTALRSVISKAARAGLFDYQAEQQRTGNIIIYPSEAEREQLRKWVEEDRAAGLLPPKGAKMR